MSSPFQRQFSAKSPLKQTNKTKFLKKLGYSDKEIHGESTETPQINWNDSITETNTWDVNKEMTRRKAYRKEKGFNKEVMNYQGKPLISTQPWKLLTSNTSNQPYGMGKIMNKVVELGKNVMIPGRFPKKVRRAYDYYKHTQKPPY